MDPNLQQLANIQRFYSFQLLDLETLKQCCGGGAAIFKDNYDPKNNWFITCSRFKMTNFSVWSQSRLVTQPTQLAQSRSLSWLCTSYFRSRPKKVAALEHWPLGQGTSGSHTGVPPGQGTSGSHTGVPPGQGTSGSHKGGATTPDQGTSGSHGGFSLQFKMCL